MKAKLVKYPFDEKKYRWDTYKAGREFQYFWDKSAPKDYNTIQPYIKVEDYDKSIHSGYVPLDFGKVPGETAYFEKSIENVKKNNPASYAMNYLPEEDLEIDQEHQKAYIRLIDRERVWDNVPEKWEKIYKFYYTLDYTVEEKDNKKILKPVVKFYKNEADLHRDGKTVNDVATFNVNFNLADLSGASLEVRNEEWWDGPYDEPQVNYFSPNIDGLEFKTSDNKYYYLKGHYNIDIQGIDESGGDYPYPVMCPSRTYGVSWMRNMEPDNTYEYSYGLNRTGIVKEYNKTWTITHFTSNALFMFYGPSPSSMPYNITPPDYENGEFVGFYVRGQKLDYNINHDLSMPIIKNKRVLNDYWVPRYLEHLADMICRYTFNIPTVYGLNWNEPFVPDEKIIKYPEVPEDSEIYDSLCHYRTNETVSIGEEIFRQNHGDEYMGVDDEGFTKSFIITFFTPQVKEYLFKNRMWEYEFNSNENNVPQRDWFISDFTNDLILDEWDTSQLHTTWFPDKVPLITNTMGWYRLWDYENGNSPMAWGDANYSYDYGGDVVELVGKSKKTIYPRFINREYIDDLIGITGIYATVSSEEYDTQYPISYYSFDDTVWNELPIIYSGNEQISNKFYYKYTNPSYKQYRLRIFTGGYYKYSNAIDNIRGEINTEIAEIDYDDAYLYNNHHSIRFDKPIVEVNGEVSLIKEENYPNENDNLVVYKYYVPSYSYPAGWCQSSFYSKMENSDCLYTYAGILNTDISYKYNNIYLISPTAYASSSSLKRLYINPNDGKYFNTPKVILSTNIKFIQDQTDDIITIPQENTTIFSYTIGDIVNRQFVPKTLQIDAPCEYDAYGSVENRTWLTYNSYTSNQWLNGYHFEGKNWNCISSPLAYVGNITNEEEPKYFYFTDKVFAPSGKYANALNIYGDIEQKDSLGNEFNFNFDDLNGGVYIFDAVVSSTNRNEYPDEDYFEGFIYKLRPQDTRFIRYYRKWEELTNVELYSDRYTYSHDIVDLVDRSYEGTICGTTTSTGEENIPEGHNRMYLGLYLGTSIPFLGIVETEIPPADILGVPQYDKQVNTSDTLKYGTVASASLTFTLNKPVGETLTHNNELLILYYDFKHRDEWERLGFFRVDSIEALDENTTSLMAHDEVYKLNKYVDDFLEAYTQTTTLDLFYRDLLNYCGCFYDTHQDIIHNGTLGMTNVYHAVKTTGVQVAHYVANLSPGFIHANIDGDIVLQQYQLKDDNLTIADYTNLVYTAYDTDMLDKVKIVSSNTVKGQSAGGSNKVYFLADNPLLSELQATSYFNNLAESILDIYNDIPTYRPATVNFLIIPRELKIGDIVNLTTPKNETYRVIVMAMTISSSGVQIKSFGTQTYPVEAESNSEFVNLINDMGEISGDVSNMMEAQRTMATEIANNREAIGENADEIEAIKTKNTQQDTSIGNNASAISTLQTLTNGFGVSVESNLATIALNGSTPNVAMKGYVDSGDSSTLASAKRYADGLVGTSVGMKFGTFRWGTATSTTATNSVHCMYIGTNDKRNGIFIPTAFVANDYNRTYMFRVYNGSYFKLYDDGYSTGGRVGWFAIGSVSFTED